MKAKLSTPMDNNPEYQNLVNLLAILSEANSRNAALQAQINQEYLDLVDVHRLEYSVNQKIIADTESAIETIVRRHPEWLSKRKTLKTPYGEVKSTCFPKLDVPSEEASIRLIKVSNRETDFIRTKEELDKEALEKLSDEELSKFGITRRPSESITIKPAEVELGKAVTELEKEAA